MEKPKSQFDGMDRTLTSEFVFRDTRGCFYIVYNIKSPAHEKIGNSFNHMLQLYYAPLDMTTVKDGFSSLKIKDGLINGTYEIIPEDEWPRVKGMLEEKLSSKEKPREFTRILQKFLLI